MNPDVIPLDTLPSMADPKKSSSSLATRQWIAVIASIVGLAIFASGCYLETRNPRSNAEDDFAWLVLGIGVSLGAFGVSLWFLRPLFALIVAIIAPPIASCFAVAVFWACLLANGFQNRDHQDFAANGVLQIAPAAQMDELFKAVSYTHLTLPTICSV